ncbi:MAG: chemotaxis response regulator protein-glutamate methylesterase [Rhodobacteraceae bacterium]|nr:chemotaxis response regulator protein-glutamate methylesterase [Paracoccaceae bacterium]
MSVLIIDDSAVMRRLIRAALATDRRLLVVGEAADPIEARGKIKALNPDVLTLDVEMPRMNGLEFLERLMRLRPMPVVMVSSLTMTGSAAAIEALSLGAIDCVGKPSDPRETCSFGDIAERIIAAAGARLRTAGSRPHSVSDTPYSPDGRVVLIGASTGGVEALDTVLGGFPANCPPTLIAQHMPAPFLASFARRLNDRIRPSLCLARDGQTIGPGEIVLAPGGTTHLELTSTSPVRCRIVEAANAAGHRPSVDVLFRSARHSASSVLAVLLTGMGRDGAEGMAELRRAGARTLVQDKESSVVWGMPRVALELGAAEDVVPLTGMARAILSRCGTTPRT